MIVDFGPYGANPRPINSCLWVKTFFFCSFYLGGRFPGVFFFGGLLEGKSNRG